MYDPYGADYFTGKSSGYGPEGYHRHTVDWPGWLEIIQQFQPDGVLCDLGCAFGYLVEAASNIGFQAFGGDLSHYALQSAAGISPRLCELDLAALPFPDHCFDVVCVFDVLEHCQDGADALAEAIRVLKPDGLLIGTTPDPLFFDREESTHCFERPPSYWLELLRQYGLDAAFRFSGYDFNFQFIARRRSSRTSGDLNRFRFDYFGTEPEFVQAHGDVQAVPRLGWGPLEEESRVLTGERSLVYLLNSLDSPCQCSISAEIVNPEHGFATLRISMDGFLLKELWLDSEQKVLEVEIPDTPIAQGGHNLTFEVRPVGASIRIRRLRIESEPLPSQDLCLSLPFDLFQRYQTTARLLHKIEATTALDVGGVLGDRHGHMASPRDFFPNLDRLISCDLRGADLPGHQIADALELPFPAASFDVTVSLDVFEHLPAGRRKSFLEEMSRVSGAWMIIGFPTLSPEVAEAERRLARTLLAGHGFLEEHHEMGLPPQDLIELWAEKRSFGLQAYPSGFLPNWVTLQSLTRQFLAMAEARDLREFNRHYNESFFDADQRCPSYRKIFLITKEGRSLPSLDEIGASSDLTREAPSLADFLGKSDILKLFKNLVDLQLNRQKALSEVQFLAGERDKEIELLRAEVAHLKEELLETPLWKIWKRRLNRG